jgi:hypothetical protein
MLCQVHRQLKLHHPLHRQQVGAPAFAGWYAAHEGGLCSGWRGFNRLISPIHKIRQQYLSMLGRTADDRHFSDIAD